MAQKPINRELLWQAIFWVLYKYSKKRPATKKRRPICGFRPSDGNIAGVLVKAIRMVLHYEIAAHKEGGPSPDFERLKSRVADSHQEKNDWTLQQRNYYASVATTYITWERDGIDPTTKKELKIVMSWADMFFRPNKDIAA